MKSIEAEQQTSEIHDSAPSKRSYTLPTLGIELEGRTFDSFGFSAKGT